jgi:hypothetical protein
MDLVISIGLCLKTLSRYSGRGQGEGLFCVSGHDPFNAEDPHPNLLPEYREKE